MARAKPRARTLSSANGEIVVPAAPGSTTDTLARIVADQLSQKWGKAAIVENVPGGAMNIGAGNVARATPDGYTLLVAPPSPLSFNHMLFRRSRLRADQVRSDHHAGENPQCPGGPQGPAGQTLEGADRLRQGQSRQAHLCPHGPGSTAHLSAAQLEVQAGIKMVHVPYRGAQPALTDVVAGHVDMFFDTLATSVPLYRDNKVKILASCRSPACRRHTGGPDLLRSGAARLPIDHLVRIGRTARDACRAGGKDQPRRRRDPPKQGGRRHAATVLSLEAGATTPADTARFFADETTLWTKVIKEAGIQPQ